MAKPAVAQVWLLVGFSSEGFSCQQSTPSSLFAAFFLPNAVIYNFFRIADPFENLMQVPDPLPPKCILTHNFAYNIRASLDP